MRESSRVVAIVAVGVGAIVEEERGGDVAVFGMIEATALFAIVSHTLHIDYTFLRPLPQPPPLDSLLSAPPLHVHHRR